MSNQITDNRIVVGIDGSPSSQSALAWALGQAELTGAAVHAVIAWDFPAFYSWEGGAVPPDDLERTARETLAEAVEAVVAARGSSVHVVQEVVHGHAATVLMDAAKEADLLVLGSRGHGGFVGALLGSISQRCSHHAACPVVIVRGIWPHSDG